MPLNKGCSISAFRENISKLIREGRPRDQAVAAAISTLKSSCKSQGKPTPDLGELVPDNVFDESMLADIEDCMAPVRASNVVWGVFDYFPAEENGICTWCGWPEGSNACQNGHDS